MESIALLAAIGCIAGFLSGLLGIGGGIILVPALILVLPQLGVAGPELVKVAMATSLATTVVTAISGARQHISSHAVDWTAILRLAPGIMAGALAGTQLSAAVNAQLLTLLFIGFLLYGALAMVRGRAAAAAPKPLPAILELSLKGFAIGAFCSMLGIAGALFTVPLLTACIPVQRAIGTSAALGIPLAVTATLGYMLVPEPAATCPIGCVGFVYLTGTGAIATTTILMAPLGAYLTHIMPARPLRQVFAVTMVVIAIHMTWKTLPSAGYAITRDAQAAGVPGWLRH